MGGEVEFNEVFLDGARTPDGQRVGEVGDGWRVANATLSGERQMVSGAGSGGVDRIGGLGVDHLLELARQHRPHCEIRSSARQIAAPLRRGTHPGLDEPTGPSPVKAGRAPGPESSIGKVHQGALNQRIQLLATDLLGLGRPGLRRWSTEYADSLPREVRGMLRSRANTIEGGTTEINKNILGERVLGLPREPDPWQRRALAWTSRRH